MKKDSRLSTISSALTACLDLATNSKRRYVTLEMCAIALSKAGIQNENADRALELLKGGHDVDPQTKRDLEALYTRLDNNYLNLHESSENLTPQTSDAFRQARAISALVHAVSTEPYKEYDAIYEAIHSLEDKTEGINIAEQLLEDQRS